MTHTINENGEVVRVDAYGGECTLGGMSEEELAAVKDFLRIRRQLSDADGSATLYTAQALTNFEKMAKNEIC